MPTTSPLRVLVVDDSDDAAVTMAFLLKRFGHEAVVAHSGEAALQQAPFFRPDVMFIDLAMPGIDGFSLARQLRETVEFADTPLVAVSGYVDAEHRTLATAAGFTEFLAKPYPLEVLQATMERVAARVNATLIRIKRAQNAEEQSRQRAEQSQSGLVEYLRSLRPEEEQASVCVEKSGISYILIFEERRAADELRLWLKLQRCRVGPVFEPRAGRFAFFVYTRRHLIGDLIAKHGGFRLRH